VDLTRQGGDRGGTGRPRPALFRALGRRDPPNAVTIAGRDYALAECLKHDSWAATGIYRGPAGAVVCKFNRQQSVLGLPMRWLGRALARRERRALDRLADVPGVVRFAGPVAADGHVLPYAVAHDYVPGHPLRRHERVDDDFFPRLRAALDALHLAEMAYVDLHKRENIVVGDDGRPHLVDFQICWMNPRDIRGRVWLARRFLRMLQQSDDYHYLKHLIRHRPDLLPPDARDLDRYRPWHNRLARMIGNPLRFMRRRILVLVGVRKRGGRAESEAEPEDAIRRESGPS
jgi:hypothetical protein